MNVIELGAIGELVGGVAVIGSLLYVGFQVRQSNRLEKAESFRTVQRDIVTTLLHHDSALLPKAISDFDGMSDEEKIRAHNWLVAFFPIARTEVVLSQENLGEISIYPGVMASFVRSRGLGHWWKFVGPTFGDEFYGFVERHNAEHDDDPAVHDLIPWLSPNGEA